MKNLNRLFFLKDLIITLFTASLAYWVAYLLRFDFSLGDDELQVFAITLPIIIFTKFLFTYLFELHRRAWKYVGLVDALDALKASFAGSALFATLILLLGSVTVPRSVYLLDFVLFPVLFIGCRVVVRVIFERRIFKKDNRWKRLAVIGAGDAGQALIREIIGRGNHMYEPIVILDDNLKKHGLRVHGVPVSGTVSDIAKITRRQHIDEVIVACHDLAPEKMAQIYETCQSLNLPLKRIPRFEDILGGKYSPFSFHNVEVEDLLPRSGVNLKTDDLAQYYRDKTILVTGAGGSIGAELVRQLCGWKPQAMICLERNEFNLYEIDLELRSSFPDIKTYSIIGDVCDGGRIDYILKIYKPDLVFHAAAYKHVPLMEQNAGEAVKNNILGTEMIASLSMKHGVKKFILISTDKAVEPNNVMGCTKRLAELILEEKFACSSTNYMAVRFGNVLDSAGSVIPLFRSQIARGGPVTVTHPDVERYFMTIPEAVQLVLKAGQIGKGGEIFVLDMGKPVRIVDLAKKMIALSGMPHVQIEYSGLRPGEKLTEVLIGYSERTTPTKHPKISAIYPARRIDQTVSGWVSSLVRDIDDMPDDEVLQVLKKMLDHVESRGSAESIIRKMIA